MTPKEKVVLLAGGLGTRLREETEYRPKPMVEIGGKPILWHIMKIYASYGFNDFVICAGYKANYIKEYFTNLKLYSSDVTISLGDENQLKFQDDLHDDWTVTIVDTGLATLTSERILKASKYLQNQRFMCTYGDGVADLNIAELLKSHINSGKLGTLTAVNPPTRFGVLEIGENSTIKDFNEKPNMQGWINGGFFVFEPEVLGYMQEGEALEGKPLRNLTKAGQLNAYTHEGFWQPMDTYREVEILNNLWDTNQAPWRVW
jgi:glucose-1-phosphate cytidylyltransferase